MTTIYWVAASPANLGTLNWATSSGGSATNTPTTGDLCIFDGGSSQTCTIAASISLAGLDCQGGTGNFAGTLVHASSTTVTITGTGVSAWRFSSGMTYSPAAVSSLVTFTATSGTQQLTSAGKNFAAITQNGAGGTVQPQDNLSITAALSGILTITAGTWDNAGAGGGTLTLTTCVLSSSNSNVRTISLGGTVTISGGSTAAGLTIWNFATSTNLTFNKNSANVVINTLTNSPAGLGIAPGTTTFNTITLNATTSNAVLNFSTSTTIGALVNNGGWTIVISAGFSLTITSGFSWVGTANNPVGIVSSGFTVATISCANACTMKWGIVQNNTATGGGTFTATDTLAGGQNLGWSVSPPADAGLTPAGIATAVWQDLLSSGDFGTAGSVGALMKAVTNLQYTVQSIGRGTVTTGATTTSVPTSAFSPAGAVAGQFIGRVILFDWNTATAALQGEVGVITGSTNAATPTFTVTGGGASATLTTAPASGDTFSVI